MGERIKKYFIPFIMVSICMVLISCGGGTGDRALGYCASSLLY